MISHRNRSPGVTLARCVREPAGSFSTKLQVRSTISAVAADVADAETAIAALNQVR
jgi:hypothetical protein